MILGSESKPVLQEIFQKLLTLEVSVRGQHPDGKGSSQILTFLMKALALVGDTDVSRNSISSSSIKFSENLSEFIDWCSLLITSSSSSSSS